jgi:hypothetical protein
MTYGECSRKREALKMNFFAILMKFDGHVEI